MKEDVRPAAPPCRENSQPAPGRRAVLLGGLTLAAAAPLIWSQVKAGTVASSAAVPGAGLPALRERLCDLVIPDTDTPGALRAGVAAFLGVALDHGLVGADAGTLARVAADLDARAGASFLKLSADRQVGVLAALDAAAYATRAPDAAGAAWQAIKGLIVTGYYTSEIGGTQELRYELVPGRWDPDLPARAGDRAWSNDWTGIAFG
ncbi:gluconate 2-dehydrogenase subunit 3 family protein [Nitrospirillum pindoramense]|uniref:gluconate 2-dehydrogenase subunit 3 family protein n=1 Tax=Nitrospirillum amazonense TaxID=28077 RepID=UPI001648BE53|nr:gluconate 2-dehydrogenase subunit 3 family protein [Nitrospirillum amazonense]